MPWCSRRARWGSIRPIGGRKLLLACPKEQLRAFLKRDHQTRQTRTRSPFTSDRGRWIQHQLKEECAGLVGLPVRTRAAAGQPASALPTGEMHHPGSTETC